MWLTKSPEPSLVGSVLTKENCHQFNRSLTKHLAVTSLHFHCLSSHHVDSESSLCLQFIAQLYFPFQIATAVPNVQNTSPIFPMSPSCLMKSISTKEFHDYSFTPLGLVIQPVYARNSPLLTGKAGWISQVLSFHVLSFTLLLSLSLQFDGQ